MAPRSVLHQEVQVPHQGDADTPLKDGVQQILGNQAHGTVEEVDDLVTGVVSREPLIVLHEQAGTQTRLLAEDHGLLGLAQDAVHLGVGDVPLAQAAVGPLVSGGGGWGDVA